MTVIVIVVLVLMWMLALIVAALIALGTAEYLLYANFAALADDCAHQASVWAWTAVAVPTLVLGPFVLASFKMTYCWSKRGVFERGSAQYTFAVLLLHGGIVSCSVLGIVVYLSESAECAAHFNRDYTGLHWLFNACVLLMGVFGVFLVVETTAVAAVALSQASDLGQDSDVIKDIRAHCKWAFEDASTYHGLPSDTVDVQTGAGGAVESAAAPTLDDAGVAEGVDAR